MYSMKLKISWGHFFKGIHFNHASFSRRFSSRKDIFKEHDMFIYLTYIYSDISLIQFKACVCDFYQIFISSSNDRPLKTMKNVFYLI